MYQTPWKLTSPVWLRFCLFSCIGAANAFAQLDVLNVNYDLQQTGANLQETTLAPTINWSKFGKVGTFPVDGQVYAQPLYVSGVAIGGATYNVLYVATMHNSVFAFNADAPQTATPLWQVNLGATVPSGLFNFTDILPEIGILGTPAIDKSKQALYVVADTIPAGSFSTPVFTLHALSLVDGHEMFGGPVDISATVQGTGAGSSNGAIAFDGFVQLQRPGLILANGTLYIAFGSHADAGNYQGWLLAYDESTLKQTAVFNSAPNGRQAAFWHSGRAPVIDSNGDVYAVTGNGDFDGMVNFGESILRLTGNLSLLDWYTPNEWSSLNSQDWDIGSAGAILIPSTNLLLVGAKSGLLYLAQDNSLGHEGPDTTATVDGVQVNAWGLFDMALWNSAPTGPTVYEFEPFGNLKAFQISKSSINSTILSQFAPELASTYAGVSVSANGGQNGLVWLLTGDNSVADQPPGTLHALDANNLATEYWNSDIDSSRDAPGVFTKFAPPLIANARVYVPTLSNSVAIYGIITATSGATPAISSIVNSASFLPAAVSPGELITIFGANLGPASEAQAMVQDNSVSDDVDNTEVMIGGVSCPILYVSSTQINTVVPFNISGASATVQVVYKGQPSASATVSIQAASPAIFSIGGDGGGPGAILNQDGSVNSSTNPAPRGSIVSIFATGAGVTTPASVDGQITACTPTPGCYPLPNLPVTLTIDSQPATLTYVGAAPGLIAGALQINAVVPSNAGEEYYDQVVLTVGGVASPTAVTIAVQ